MVRRVGTTGNHFQQKPNLGMLNKKYLWKTLWKSVVKKAFDVILNIAFMECSLKSSFFTSRPKKKYPPTFFKDFTKINVAS